MTRKSVIDKQRKRIDESGEIWDNERRLKKKDCLIMSLYNVIVRKECDRYCAEVPDLPGCFTEADTLDELAANVREAITLYLEDSPVVQHSSIMQVAV